jgi:hypothetical protein
MKKQNMLEKKVKLLTHATKPKEDGNQTQADEEAPSTDMNMSTPISTTNCKQNNNTSTHKCHLQMSSQ